MRVTAFIGMLLALPAWAEGVAVSGGGSVDLGRDHSVSAFVDLEKGGLHAGLAMQRSTDETDNELDLTLGYYGETGVVSYDIGYRYLHYPDLSGADYGAFTLEMEAATKGLALSAGLSLDPEAAEDAVTLSLGLAAEQPLSDSVTLALDLSAEPLSHEASAGFGADVAFNDRLTFSARFGASREEGEPWQSEWRAGLGWAVAEQTSLDLQYLGGAAEDRGYFTLALSWEFEVSSD